MSGHRSRNKGKNGELEWCQFLSERLGFHVERELGQPRDGGHDVHVHPFSMQVKRTERLRVYDALQQAEDDCPPDLMPVVACRSNRKQWIIVMDAEDFVRLWREAL